MFKVWVRYACALGSGIQQIWLNLLYELAAALTWRGFLSLNFHMVLSCGSIFKLVMWYQVSPDFKKINLVKGTLSFSGV